MYFVREKQPPTRWLAGESTTNKNMALKDHAIVEREGFKVPLLGIPPDAVLQECELCHTEYPLRDVEMSDSGQILCKKCRVAEPANAPHKP